ncbi:MAG: Ig-like domain-containing protein [Bacteroidaceae bacterium]|nr:Ig-like domain-containing protein [Bacteroidaceae bacterium]
MKKHLHFLLPLIAFMILSNHLSAQHFWDGTTDKVITGGDGSQKHPYLISTPEQLAGLAERVNIDREDFSGKHFRLTEDIYLNSFAEGDDTLMWTPIGQIFMDWNTTDTCAFRGSFDGDGHTIYNIYYAGGMGWGSDWDPYAWNSDITTLDLSVFYKALFGVVDGGTIENVRMAGGMMSALSQAMLAVSVQKGSTIRNCHVEGTLHSSAEGTEMAGLVFDNHGLIENCSANVTTWGYRAAPIAANNRADGIIRNCVAKGEVNITCHAVGAGFVYNNEGLIEQCESSTNVTAKLGKNAGRENSLSAAGFTEKNSGIIRECTAHGKLSTDNTPIFASDISVVAGFCMTNTGRIESCYADGEYKDNSAGDFPAKMVMFVRDNGSTYDGKSGIIINCFAAGKMLPYLQPKLTTWESNAFVFHANFCGETFGEDIGAAPGMEVNCYWRSDGIPVTDNALGTDGSWSAHEATLSYMQSQAFVDTLNRVAHLMGTSQWEYRPGQLPRATGIRTKDVQATQFFAGGDGTKDNPFLISNKEQLTNVAWLSNHGYDFRGENLRQTADIVLNAPREQWAEQMPAEWESIGAIQKHPRCNGTWSNYFCGHYDGGFHEVKSMYIDNLNALQGLFGNISRRFDSVIRNLGITDAYVHASSGGILAGYIGGGARIIQCYVSGEALSVGDEGGYIGSFASDKGANVMMLNCMSSAEVNGAGAFLGNEWSSYNSQIVNALYTGASNTKGPDLAFEQRENCFMDGDKSAGGTEEQRKTTEWMQSAECVNVLNDAVSRWNAAHADDADLQLNYWTMREGNYPRVATNEAYMPRVTITFASNGDTILLKRYIEAGSKVVVPQRPTKEGQLFAGWYKDEQLTRFFDFETEQPATDLTLYAKWIKNDIYDYDLTPFSNKFATTFHIKTAAQMRGFAAVVNGIYDTDGNQIAAPNELEGKNVVLDNDILLNDTTDWNYWGHNAYAVPWKPIGHHAEKVNQTATFFKGTFDGQGHIIYGMYIEMGAVPMNTDASITGYGLFGIINGNNTIIRNVGIRASVIDMQYHDGLYYYGDTGTGGRAGLLVDYLGGENNAVEKCFAEGRIICPNKKNWNGYVAGLIGEERGKTNSINNSFSRVMIEDPQQRSSKRLAGLANTSCSVENCYSADNSYYGLGFEDNEGNSYYDKELVTDKSRNGGKLTAEMKAKATFVDWDFDETWGRNDDINDGYPYLRLFYPDAPADSDDPIVVTGVHLEEADQAVTVYVGEPLQLHAHVLPENAVNQNLNWEITTIQSTSPALTIDQNGLLTGHKSSNGYFTVKVTSEWGGYSALCYVTVKEREHTWSVTINEYNTSLTIGDSYQFSASVYPEDAVNTNVIWTSSNEDILTVTPDGLATAVGTGTAYLTVKAEDQTNVETGKVQASNLTKTTRAIQVLPIYVTSIQWQEEPLTEMIVGDEQQLAVVLQPDNATYKGVTWSSTNTNVLTVTENGLVKAVGKGNAFIYAIADVSKNTSDGFRCQLMVQITAKYAEPESIVINEGNLKMDIDEQQQLTVTILPANADQTVKWKSSSSRYVSVSSTGLVTMLREPTSPVTITATAANGLSASTTVEYKYAVKSIEINEGDIEMELGQERQLTVTILPAEADQSVRWTSSNPFYVRVSSTGLVTMLRKPASPVTITATTSSYGLTASITVTFKEPDAINDVIYDMRQEEWFTIDGRKLNERPMKSGIYIRNGQKVVIR